MGGRMSEPRRKSNVRDDETPKVKLEEVQSRGALGGKEELDAYLRRKAEVSADDHQQFQQYLQQKAKVAPPPGGERSAKSKFTKSKFNRRNLLKVVAGTAVVGEAAAVGHSWITGGSVSEQGL